LNRYIVESEIANVDKTVGTIMKTKLLQRLIQLAAVIFLVCLAVRDVKRSGFVSLIPFGMFGIVFLAQWWIDKKFPQTAARCHAAKIQVWIFILLTLILTVLSFINFDVSTSKAFSLTLNFTFILLVVTYMQQQRLSRQLVEEQKNAATM
jgi:quinol-cytochrome oxidoreductase complex cytochrome b subunit